MFSSVRAVPCTIVRSTMGVRFSDYPVIHHSLLSRGDVMGNPTPHPPHPHPHTSTPIPPYSVDSWVLFPLCLGHLSTEKECPSARQTTPGECDGAVGQQLDGSLLAGQCRPLVGRPAIKGVVERLRRSSWC